MAQKSVDLWDYAAVGTLVRVLFELRLTLFYLCIDRVGDEEWSCRLNIMHLHDCVARQLLFADMGSLDESNAFEQVAESLRQRLKQNSYFLAMPSKRQNELLRGKQAFLKPFEDIALASGTELGAFRMLYRFLSSHAHGLPMAFYRIGEKRGRGVRSDVEEGYLTLWLGFGADLLVEARQEYESLFTTTQPS